LDGKNELILPVCGKRCYTNVINRRIEFHKAADASKGSGVPSNIHWGRDGTSTSKSSEDCLIDWITTEENASSYFGGVGKDGQTSSNRKHTYHLLLSDTIRKENGEYYIFLY
jgi:hypothetical protein